MVEFIDNALTSNISLITLDRGETLKACFTLIDTTGKKFEQILTDGVSIVFHVANLQKQLGIDPDTGTPCFYFAPDDTKYLELGEYEYKIIVTITNPNQPVIVETVARGIFIIR